MNSPPTSPINNYPRGHPREFEQIITAKSHNFIGREFVFTAINEFIHRYHRGYFTIIGAPGSGKSAILAKYALDHPDVVYYNVELAGKNHADEFFRNICTQLLEIWQQTSQNHLPDNATEGSWFLSMLLQQISEQLPAHQKLIIAIDGLNFIDNNLQPSGTNLFYLPRYLPDGVYFLLTRRPFPKEKSGLLIEAPSQTLDLADYPQENRRDIQAYIEENLTPLTPLPLQGRGEQEMEGGGQDLEMGEQQKTNSPLLAGKGSGEGSTPHKTSSPLLAGEGLGEGSTHQQEFCTHLITASEDNFMYISQILQAMTDGFYTESFQYNQTPPGLETYYQQHLQTMIPPTQASEFALKVLQELVKQQQPISAAEIADILNTDEFEVEEVLENWLEFLQKQNNTQITYYSLYHSHFRHWLARLTKTL